MSDTLKAEIRLLHVHIQKLRSRLLSQCDGHQELVDRLARENAELRLELQVAEKRVDVARGLVTAMLRNVLRSGALPATNAARPERGLRVVWSRN